MTITTTNGSSVQNDDDKEELTGSTAAAILPTSSTGEVKESEKGGTDGGETERDSTSDDKEKDKVVNDAAQAEIAEMIVDDVEKNSRGDDGEKNREVIVDGGEKQSVAMEQDDSKEGEEAVASLNKVTDGVEKERDSVLPCDHDDDDRMSGEKTNDPATTPPPEQKDVDDEEEEEPPKIFLRPFSEIREANSSSDDDDDDDEVVFVGEEKSKDTEEEVRRKRLEAVRVRLAEISTKDCESAGVEMGFQVGDEQDQINHKTNLLNNAAGKLSLWLNRKQQANTQKPPPPNTTANWVQQQQTRTQPPPPPVNNRLVRIPQPQQQQFTQLYFSNGGLFFGPATGQPQQQQQQIRLQNGMLLQQQQQINNNRPTQTQQQIESIIRQQLNTNNTNRNVLQQQRHNLPPPPTTASQQYRASRNVVITRHPPPPTNQQVRMIRPMQQQQIRPTAPIQQRPVNTPGVIPVKLPTAAPNSNQPPPPKGSVTAGNQKPIPGTVDEADSDLQNKTFPSLVVNVKTCLGSRGNKVAQSKARSELDAAVKSVLINTPSQFTEWLMRKGILRLDHTCDTHKHPLKLGMYSDTSRQPFSGGYVWTSECCTEKQVSVFSGSIFEGSKYPPGTVLKLVYHWACQTPANNVLQWVKVSSLYLKNFFTLLRAVCIAWLHEMCPPLGGEQRYVEIGVITLGSSAETSRGVKNVNVEILGVFDPLTKVIRMKVINSMQGVVKDKTKTASSTSEQGARAFQILWPLTHWVDKRSILLIDGIIDKALFHELGFKNIQQCGENNKSGSATNMNVMNYLRNLVPKMFSSTLSVLSKSIVQQFLDELSWREMYGHSVLITYDNILDHTAKISKWELTSTESLITRLNKINQNPFIDWSHTKQTRRCPLNTIPLSLRNEPGIKECIRHVMKEDSSNKGRSEVQAQPVASISAAAVVQPRMVKKDEKNAANVANLQYYKAYYSKVSKDLCLQVYYYGRKDGNSPEDGPGFSLKCPLCVKTFHNNTDIPRHIYGHVTGSSGYKLDTSICHICLKDMPTGMSIGQHISQAHKLMGVPYCCRICEEKFKSEEDLTVHMWDLHNARETPYKCGICGYSTCFHHDIVQHLMEHHSSTPQTTCPLCLKPFPISSSPQSLKQLISHFQSHTTSTRRSKKCPRCTLHFPTESELDSHLLYHFPNDINSNWQPFELPQHELPIPMAQPPVSKTPIPLSMSSSNTYMDSQPPVNKKPKVTYQPKAKSILDGMANAPPPPPIGLKKSTLNVSISVPIDTNEKFGGSKYRINVPGRLCSSSLLVGEGEEEGEDVAGNVKCGECGLGVGVGGEHFIGKLICTKCRYITSCQSAMDLHHKHNHDNSSKQIKPVIKTNPIQRLGEEMWCKKCAEYSSDNPYLLATHLIDCDSSTVCPKSRLTAPTQQPDDDGEDASSSPNPTTDKPSTEQQQQTTIPPTIPTFEDMLTLDATMGGGMMPPGLGSNPLFGSSSSNFSEPQTPVGSGPLLDASSASGLLDGDWDGWDGCFSSLMGGK